jgi:UDP:flavonoid glycosyltransferase YjiC (YdhE family)
MHRADWTEGEFAAAINRLLTDDRMAARLAATSAAMQAHHGPTKAARLLDALLAGA